MISKTIFYAGVLRMSSERTETSRRAKWILDKEGNMTNGPKIK